MCFKKIMAFEIPRVNQCCFCVPLRTASLLIGYISMLISLILIPVISYYTYVVVTYVKKNDIDPNPEHTVEEVHKMSITLYISFGYYMMVFLFNFGIHLLLVIGVHKNKPQYLKIYVNTAYFLLALAITLVIVVFVFMGFLATIPMLKWAVTIISFIVVVRSTYLEMEERNKPKTYEMQNLYMPPQQALSALVV